MRNFSQKDIATIENFNLYINRRVPTIVSYLVLMLILKEVFGIPFSPIVFLSVSFMLLSSLVLTVFFDRFLQRGEALAPAYFLYTIFDLCVLTLVIYHLEGIFWLGFIFYSFYILLNFMTFPRTQALFLTAWIMLLYIGLVLMQYFRILPSPMLFPPQSQTYFHFPYVFTTTIAYIATFLLVAYYSEGFYQLYAGRIFELKETREILEKEKLLLEERVEARKKELDKERESLQERVEQRKKELELEETGLQEKVEELEKFKKITIGREEKLHGLEKELIQLKKELKF